MKPLNESDPAIRDSPTFWFVVLETARKQCNFHRAAQAQNELERLGVRVRYARQKRGVTEEAGRAS